MYLCRKRIREIRVMVTVEGIDQKQEEEREAVSRESFLGPGEKRDRRERKRVFGFMCVCLISLCEDKREKKKEERSAKKEKRRVRKGKLILIIPRAYDCFL